MGEIDVLGLNYATREVEFYDDVDDLMRKKLPRWITVKEPGASSDAD